MGPAGSGQKRNAPRDFGDPSVRVRPAPPPRPSPGCGAAARPAEHGFEVGERSEAELGESADASFLLKCVSVSSLQDARADAAAFVPRSLEAGRRAPGSLRTVRCARH